MLLTFEAVSFIKSGRKETAAIYILLNQGTSGCTPKSVPMVFIVFSRDSWGL